MNSHYCSFCGRLVEDEMDELLDHLKKEHNVDINGKENQELASDDVVLKYYEVNKEIKMEQKMGEKEMCEYLQSVLDRELQKDFEFARVSTLENSSYGYLSTYNKGFEVIVNDQVFLFLNHGDR